MTVEDEEEDEVKTSTDRESRLPWAAAENGEEAQRAPALRARRCLGGRSYRVINSRDLPQNERGDSGPHLVSSE